jgi:glyceraldehyde 3-phosphate dehydrogenase
MVPTSTGAATAIGLVMPDLKGKLDGQAIRVPTPNVSIVDLVFNARRPTTVEEVNAAFVAAADGPLKGILAIAGEEVVSSDLLGHPASSIVDTSLTQVLDGTLVKVLTWYDNEWGFSNRMIDLALKIGARP